VIVGRDDELTVVFVGRLDLRGIVGCVFSEVICGTDCFELVEEDVCGIRPKCRFLVLSLTLAAIPTR
jgi:hypothetical protein